MSRLSRVAWIEAEARVIYTALQNRADALCTDDLPSHATPLGEWIGDG